MLIYILTSIVVYYHVCILLGTSLLLLDYALDVNYLEGYRWIADEPLFIMLWFVEIPMIIGYALSFYMNSTLILSILWVSTFIVLITILFTLIGYYIHKNV